MDNENAHSLDAQDTGWHLDDEDGGEAGRDTPFSVQPRAAATENQQLLEASAVATPKASWRRATVYHAVAGETLFSYIASFFFQHPIFLSPAYSVCCLPSPL